MRHPLFSGLPALILGLFLFAGLALAGNAYLTVDTNLYPYAPSLLQYEKTEAEFTDPETCSDCHYEKYEEWTSSMHALAFTDPVYQGELNYAVKKAGHDIARQCEGCHSPAAVVTGEIKGPGIKGLSPVALGGVSCDVCHSVKGHTHWQTPSRQPENGSLILSPGKNSEEGPILTKYGPIDPDEECGDEFHQCNKSELHLSSELCAGCHQVYNYKTHTPLEETYNEWKKSAYAINNIHCQDCHMVEIDTFKRSADSLVRPSIDEYRHFFNGANFLLYHLNELAAKKAGDDELAANANAKYTMAVARLKAAADVEVQPVYKGDRLSEIKVRVKNVRAGHRLPTSLTNIRQVWLEITASDAKGKEIITSGTVNGKGKLPEDVRLINSETQDENFHTTIDPWKAQTFLRHDTIVPKGYKDFYFGISLKKYGLALRKGKPVTVQVKLRYRQADQAVAEKILSMVPDDIHLEAIYGIKEIPILPIIDMVNKTVKINGS